MTVDGSSSDRYCLIACWRNFRESIASKAVWIANSLDGKWHSSKFKCRRCNYRCFNVLVWCVLYSNFSRDYSWSELWIDAAWTNCWWNGSQYWCNPWFYWENGSWIGHSSFKWRHDCWWRFDLNSNDAWADLRIDHDDSWRRRRLIRGLRSNELGWLNRETAINALITGGTGSINQTHLRAVIKSFEVASVITNLQSRILELS